MLFGYSQKRLFRRYRVRVVNFFICLNICLIFGYVVLNESIMCQPEWLQDWKDAGLEIFRTVTDVMQDRCDGGK